MKQKPSPQLVTHKPPLSSFVEGATPISKEDLRLETVNATLELEELRQLRSEVEAFLATDPNAIRVCEGGGPENLAASLAATISQIRSRTLPKELTPELKEVLAFDFHEAKKIADRFRANGAAVEDRFEEEQAFVVWWLLGYALKYGPSWRTNAAADLPKFPKK